MDINFHTGEYTVNQALFTSFLICNWLLKNLSTTKISESKHYFKISTFYLGEINIPKRGIAHKSCRILIECK